MKGLELHQRESKCHLSSVTLHHTDSEFHIASLVTAPTRIEMSHKVWYRQCKKESSHLI